MSVTETVQTVHGDIEVEMTECDNCGERIKAEDAIGVTAPAKIKFRYLGEMDIQGVQRANLCEYCSESFFRTTRSHGAIPTGWLNLLATRIAAFDDPMFMLFVSFFGAILGFGTILLISSAIAVIV